MVEASPRVQTRTHTSTASHTHTNTHNIISVAMLTQVPILWQHQSFAMVVGTGTVKTWMEYHGIIAADNGTEVMVHRSVLSHCVYLRVGERVWYQAFDNIATVVELTEQTVMDRDRDATTHARAFMNARRLADLTDSLHSESTLAEADTDCPPSFTACTASQQCSAFQRVTATRHRRCCSAISKGAHW
jgi:hypothetical protein